MKINKIRLRRLWFCMAVIFVVGIFYSMKCEYPVLADRIDFERDFDAAMSIKEEYEPVMWRSVQRDARVMPVESEYKVSDFCTNSTNYRNRTNRNDSGAIRRAAFWVLCVFFLFTYLCIIRCRWYCTEKQIPVFHLIYFIHRSDGKKRVCFVA